MHNAVLSFIIPRRLKFPGIYVPYSHIVFFVYVRFTYILTALLNLLIDQSMQKIFFVKFIIELSLFFFVINVISIHFILAENVSSILNASNVAYPCQTICLDVFWRFNSCYCKFCSTTHY